MSTPENQNSNERESAAQIGAKPNAVRAKAVLIHRGAWRRSDGDKYGTGMRLAIVLAHLTSTDKEFRAWAKNEVREFVKIGQAIGPVDIEKE